MEQNILDKLRVIWESIKNYCVCIYLGGSRVVPFISHTQDFDVLFVYNTAQDGRRIREILRREEIKQLRAELRDNYNVVLFGHTVEYFNELHPWSYQQPELLFGSFENYQRYKVLDYKSEYLAWVRKGVALTKRFYEERNQIYKPLYHSLIVYYFLLNNSYELTPEQITNINIAHDAAHHPELAEQALRLLDWLDAETNNLKEDEAQ